MMWRMKCQFYILSCLLFSVPGCRNGEDQNSSSERGDEGTSVLNSDLERAEGYSSENIGGVYAFGEDIEKGPVGSVLVYPLTDSSALFFMDVNRGAPSYNMGQMQGEIKMINNTGRFEYEGDEHFSCALKFEFSPNLLKVRTVDGQDECGFGFGVRADYDYKKIDESIPQFYLYGPGDTVWFEETGSMIR